jgi:hypothetical protein
MLIKKRPKGFRASPRILWGMRHMIAKAERPSAATRPQSGILIPERPKAITRRGGPATETIQIPILLHFSVLGSKAFSLIKKVIRTGIMVIARTDDEAIANVFVKARGLNNRPDCS